MNGEVGCPWAAGVIVFAFGLRPRLLRLVRRRGDPPASPGQARPAFKARGGQSSMAHHVDLAATVDLEGDVPAQSLLRFMVPRQDALLNARAVNA